MRPQADGPRWEVVVLTRERPVMRDPQLATMQPWARTALRLEPCDRIVLPVRTPRGARLPYARTWRSQMEAHGWRGTADVPPDCLV